MTGVTTYRPGLPGLSVVGLLSPVRVPGAGDDEGVIDRILFSVFYGGYGLHGACPVPVPAGVVSVVMGVTVGFCDGACAAQQFRQVEAVVRCVFRQTHI